MKDRPSISGSAVNPADPDGQIIAPIGELRTSARAVDHEALLSHLISTNRNGFRGHESVRLPGSLRLHPAFNDLNLSGWLINSDLQGKSRHRQSHSKQEHQPALLDTRFTPCPNCLFCMVGNHAYDLHRGSLGIRVSLRIPYGRVFDFPSD